MKHVLAVLVFGIAACGDDGGGGGDAGPGNDIDFDGVPNDVDNCPMSANAFQGNEDGDRFGDACDPCPMIADDDPPDADGDGVADACDPKPVFIGDRIAFFEGFHQGKPSGWEEVGTWGGADDHLTANHAGPGHMALILTDRTRETVRAEITVVSAMGADSEVGLLDNKLENPSASGVACVITGAPAVAVYETTDSANAETTPFELTAGQTYEVRLQRENSTYTCTARNVATSATATAEKTITLTNAPYLSGIKVTGASVRIDWFMLVESL